jgi:phosphoserine phosphatase
MSNDQASAVDGEAAFLDALGPAPVEEEEQEQTEEVAAPEGEEAETEAVEGEEVPPELFKITVKNEAGEDEEKDITLDELAKGYMLQADYTRKTSAVAEEKRQVEAKFSKDLSTFQQAAVDKIDQLQALVMKQAAPELGSVDWVTLASTDPAEFVRLKARQEQLSNTYNALEGEKVQLHQKREQHIAQQVDQALKQSDELLTKAIEGFDGTKAGKLLENVEKSLGWKPKDIQMATRLIVEAGMKPETIGQILVLAHKAAQFDELSAKKPVALKKVAAAPKVIRPAAPQPRKQNQAALERLQKTGRGEDFMKFL